VAQHLEASLEITLNMDLFHRVTRVWIHDEARRTGASVETVIERLIQRGIAVERQAARVQRYDNLDHLAGTWSAEEADAFRVATADFTQIDTTLWR
jgi:hypothetical protein